MKKIVAMIIIVVGIIAGCVEVCGQCLYPMVGVIVEMNREEDFFTVVDTCGEAWEFTECEDWENGDICAVVMFTNFTETIEDDIPLKVRYCGWIDE